MKLGQNGIVSFSIRLAVFQASGSAFLKLQRNGFDFIFLTGFTGLTGFFSPSARSPFGRRPFYPDDPFDPVQFSFKDENPFLFLPYFDLRFFTFLF